jgi:hypothetical protein
MDYKHLSRLAVILLAASLVGVATGAATTTKETKADKFLEQISKESATAMRQLRFARVAIFDGQPERAEKYLYSAKENLSKAQTGAPKLTVTVKSQKKVGGKTITKQEEKETTDLVAIDAWLGLSEDFIASPEKKAKIKEANEHLKKGESGKAIDILRAADIGVSVTRVFMPVKATLKHVDKAIGLLKNHKYYEANLALKGAEDGLISDTVLLYEPVKAKTKSGSEKK